MRGSFLELENEKTSGVRGEWRNGYYMCHIRGRRGNFDQFRSEQITEIHITFSQKYIFMSERKMWTIEEDRIIGKLVKENNLKAESTKWRWSQIANLLQEEIPNCKRTGKQCRERWHNQLDPSILKDKEWNNQEMDQLFKLQDQHGNKWASIAREMPGRTDNNIKNFFYSSLRRAIRQINQYVAMYKKKSNIKPFKQTILTKILNINDEKYRDKLDIKKMEAVTLANELKNMLAKLSAQNEDSDLDQQDLVFREKIVKSIQQFNKICKKKKSKKSEDTEEPDLLLEIDPQSQNLNQEARIHVRHLDGPKKKRTICKKKKEVQSRKSKQSNETNLPLKKNEESSNRGKKLFSKNEKDDDPQKPEKLLEPIKMRKRKSEAELLGSPFPQELNLRHKSFRNSNELKESLVFERQKLKNSMNFEFLQHSGMLHRRNSMENNRQIKLEEGHGWINDNIQGLQYFEFKTLHNPMELSLAYREPTDGRGYGLADKESMNISGYLGLMNKQPSKFEANQGNQ